jgi:hypothetical protein
MPTIEALTLLGMALLSMLIMSCFTRMKSDVTLPTCRPLLTYPWRLLDEADDFLALRFDVGRIPSRPVWARWPKVAIGPLRASSWARVTAAAAKDAALDR